MSRVTITNLAQAAAFVGCEAGPILSPDVDTSGLDSRRFTAIGITELGREWIGIGNLPGPGISPALVFFLPFHVDVVGLRRTRTGQWSIRGKRYGTKLQALLGARKRVLRG